MADSNQVGCQVASIRQVACIRQQSLCGMAWLAAGIASSGASCNCTSRRRCRVPCSQPTVRLRSRQKRVPAPAARQPLPVHVRGARLPDAVHPPHRLRLHSWIQQRLCQDHVLCL